MSFIDTLVEQPKEEGSNKDLAPYREVMDRVTATNRVTIVVVTGEVNETGQNKGKGKEAMKHDRAFRDVARERNVGLRVIHNNMPDGRTRLSLETGPKRESTPEQIKQRTEAAALARRTKAVDALMAQGVAKEEAENQVDAAAAKRAADRKAEQDKKTAAAKPTAPATKATQKASA